MTSTLTLLIVAYGLYLLTPGVWARYVKAVLYLAFIERHPLYIHNRRVSDRFLSVEFTYCEKISSGYITGVVMKGGRIYYVCRSDEGELYVIPDSCKQPEGFVFIQ